MEHLIGRFVGRFVLFVGAVVGTLVGFFDRHDTGDLLGSGDGGVLGSGDGGALDGGCIVTRRMRSFLVSGK